MNRSSRQKNSKETLDLNHTLDQIDLTDTYVTSQPTIIEYIFFSSAHSTFSRIDYMIGHKTSLSKFKKAEIISTIFSDHKGMALEINKRKVGNSTNMWKLNNTLLNNQCMKEEIKWEILSISRQMKMETEHNKSYRMLKKQS